MSVLIKKFTFDRNTFKADLISSADAAASAIELVRTNNYSDKTSKNKVQALASSMGLFVKNPNGEYELSALANSYLALYAQNKEDAWRWLATRSLWLYSIPSGTNAVINVEAKKLNISFSFFRKMVQLLLHLEALEHDERFLYYDEIANVLNNDANWALSSADLFNLVLKFRNGKLVSPTNKEGFLGELEERYDVPRDNLHALFNKNFAQTGLFEYIKFGTKSVGISLRTDLDAVLQRRVRFIVDHPSDWSLPQSWADHLKLRVNDLPLEVSKLPSASPIITGDTDILHLVKQLNLAFRTAGFNISDGFLKRYIASLFTKRFVILAGMTGSGKTKLAQLLASWLDEPNHVITDIFPIGLSLKADRANYLISSANSSTLNVEDTGSKITSLPIPLIYEWVEVIRNNNFDRSTSAENIRTQALLDSKYSSFIHGYSSQLKAAAFHIIENPIRDNERKRYAVVPVEATWSGMEDIFGYADALDGNRYVSRESLQLILRARENYNSFEPTLPYFLILDEMNLSHVERYFAAILSAIESGESIPLHGSLNDIDGVPGKLALPPNLFIVGTINVDETTYQFSPKVLDRANVMEFRVSSEQMSIFLEENAATAFSTISGKGRGYADLFMKEATSEPELSNDDKVLIAEEMMLFYGLLSTHGAEFGFRTAKEVSRFISYYKRLDTHSKFTESFDAQIVQKILPKIHGSQRKVEPVLRGLAYLCYYQREWRDFVGDQVESVKKKDAFIDRRNQMTDPRNKDFNIILSSAYEDYVEFLSSSDAPFLPISFEKIIRMLKRLNRDGFTSFAEA